MHSKHRRGLFLGIGAGTMAAALAVGVVTTAHAATMFTDDFNDGNASGWSKSGGTWTVVKDGTSALQQGNSKSELARYFAGQSGWTDYQVQARVKPVAFSGGNRFVGVALRAEGATKMYRLALINNGRAELQAVNGSSITSLGSVALNVSTGTWYTLRIQAKGSSISGVVNGKTVGSTTNKSSGNGRAGLVTSYASARFDDVSVSEAGSVPPAVTPPAGTPTTVSPTEPGGGANPAPANPPAGTNPPAGSTTGLAGWATQNGGTTGGSGGSTVTVNNLSALTSAVGSSNAQIVRVSGRISCSGMIKVRSNKSILGNSGATIAGCGFTISGQRNVIIRNLTFRDWNDDAINVESAGTNVWVDHNSFSNGYDGAVDIKRGSDFVTVSWNRISNHSKSMLLGHSDDNASQDVGHLRVTYHHNWFDGSGTRHPRVRFGNPVHVYNNYYRNNEYGVASTMNAGVLVEGNYFDNCKEPTLVGYADSGPGTLVQRNNAFVGSGSPESSGSIASIPYKYTMDNANNVKAIVTGGAGAGRITP